MKEWELNLPEHQIRCVDRDVSRVIRMATNACDRRGLDLRDERVTLRRTRDWVHPSMQVVVARTSKWA